MHDRPLVLQGPPGSGKTTLGPALAERLGYAHVDLDAALEASAGASVADLFARDGEASFRARERALLRETLTAPRTVLSVGGGALVNDTLRREVLRACTVVSLTAPPAVLLARILAGPVRPLVTHAPDPRAALDALLDARRAGYAEAHATVDTSGPVDLDALVAMHRRAPLVAPLGLHSHRVEIAPLAQAEHDLAALLPSPSRGTFVYDRRVFRLQRPMAVFEGLGAQVALPSGEVAKSPAWVTRVHDAALAQNADRRHVIACWGGGVVSDVGGFAAATLLRGVRYVTVPTTLLAMVDASVGGKTAVNHPRGKNLVGAFHHPTLVWADPRATHSLPRRDWRAGLAEVLKVALTLDPTLLDLLDEHADVLRHPPDAWDRGADLRRTMIARAVQAKIDVVAVDEREAGPRMVLNFGHTAGHAIESASKYALRHGECVNVGMNVALAVGVKLGVTPAAVRERALKVMASLTLPMRADVPFADACAFLATDKKRAGDTLRMVLATELGRATVCEVATDEIHSAMRPLCAQGPA